MLLNWHGFFISVFSKVWLRYPWSFILSKITILTASTVIRALLDSAITTYTSIFFITLGYTKYPERLEI